MASIKKYFGTDGIRGRVGGPVINPEFVVKLGWACGQVFKKHFGIGIILIGKDTRISGYLLESSLVAGLSAAGMPVQLIGPLPTPGVAYLVNALRARAGLVLSASHNVYTDNGIKFFLHNGRKLSDDLQLEIESYLDQPLVTVPSHALGKASRVDGAAFRYIEYCKSKFPSKLSLEGMKIVVDCANGATYHVAPPVFHELGAQVTAMHNTPDGFNINDQSGSVFPEKLAQKVVQTGADCGIAFDGDGDRVAMVDHRGNILNGDVILYLLARYYASKGDASGGVVSSYMCNHALRQAIQKLGLKFEQVNVGDQHIMMRLEKNQWTLGGEPSGHILNLDSTLSGDGIISALCILSYMIESASTLAELHQGYTPYPQLLFSIPNHIAMNNDHFNQTIQSSITQLHPNGRLLLRESGTEPVTRVLVEHPDQRIVDGVGAKLYDFADAP